MIDHSTTDLVQDVPLPAFLLGLEAVHPFLDALTVVRPAFPSIPQGGKLRSALVAVLLTSPERPAGEYQGCSVSHDGLMDIAVSTASTRSPGTAGGTRRSSSTMCQAYLEDLLSNTSRASKNSTGLPVCRDRHRDRSQAPTRASSRVLPLLQMPVFFQIVVRKPRRYLGYLASLFPCRLSVRASCTICRKPAARRPGCGRARWFRPTGSLPSGRPTSQRARHPFLRESAPMVRQNGVVVLWRFPCSVHRPGSCCPDRG